ELTHPNIARLYDVGVTDAGQPYLALEYVDGKPLHEYCDSRRLPIDARLELLAQVARAVQYAHSQLVVHRDIKPSNILVPADGQRHLLDFGIAKLLAADASVAAEQPRMGGRAFTPEYASPEQITGAAIGTGTDVYSLGVVMFELLTGARPYRPRRASA